MEKIGFGQWWESNNATNTSKNFCKTSKELFGQNVRFIFRLFKYSFFCSLMRNDSRAFCIALL